MSWWDDTWDYLRDLRHEYLGGSAKEVASHLLFKNEPITMALEVAEARQRRGADDPDWIQYGAAVSESMDKDPVADAKMAVGFGAAWITGGKSVPLGLSGVQSIMNDATRQYQSWHPGQDSSGSTGAATGGGTGQSLSIIDQLLAFIEELIAALLTLFGLGPDPSSIRMVNGVPVDVSGQWHTASDGSQERAYVAATNVETGEEVIIGQKRQAQSSGTTTPTPPTPTTSRANSGSSHLAVPVAK